ncbi:ATP-binding protein [Actinomadura sp. GC306]|uniref:ATP-binding protein n=1 Tax=Actinomadura sp. GC306 TaxID=2530367 RepID=UPI001404C99F|nr:ATP-binding protein [Actinomadura sp. GC306]
MRRSVGCARSFVREAVLGHSPADERLLDDLVTVVSETVSNAVTHTASGLAGGEVTVVLSLVDGVYRLEVADDGAAGARPHVKAEVGAESGRGMRIVAALAARWGFRADGPRTVVWAEFPAPAAGGRDRAPFSDRG